jgi:hypothetical protein
MRRVTGRARERWSLGRYRGKLSCRGDGEQEHGWLSLAAEVSRTHFLSTARTACDLPSGGQGSGPASGGPPGGRSTGKWGCSRTHWEALPLPPKRVKPRSEHTHVLNLTALLEERGGAPPFFFLRITTYTPTHTHTHNTQGRRRPKAANGVELL